MTARGRRALVAALVGAVAVGVALRGGSAAPDRSGGPLLASRPSRPAVEPEPVATPPPAAAAPTVVSAAPPRERPDLPAEGLAKAVADDYRRRARYPRSSQPLEPGEDPIVRDREVTPVIAHGPGGEEPGLAVFPLRAGFESPEPAVLLAYLTVGGRRIAAREMRATVTTEDLSPIAALTYNDDGIDGDVVAGDGLYTAVFAPAAADPSPQRARSYLVRVQAVTLGNIERAAATSFLYSAPDAQLTGLYRDALVAGNLAVDAEVDVLRPGRFHLEATLYTADGATALAWAQTAAVLDPGLHWMTLPFQGLILHEKGSDAPYLLRWVALSTTTDMPNAKNRPVENAWVTRAYQATAFSDEPANDPGLLDAAERAEHDRIGAGLEAGG